MSKLWALSAVGLALLCGLAAGQESHVVLRVNCGATEQYVDEAGNLWLPDRAFVQGARWGAVGGLTVFREGLQVKGTDAPGVYLYERFGMDRYEFGVPNGTYSVRLHFAETWEGITEPGQRVFSVRVEGATALEDFDPLAEGGFAMPVVRTVDRVQVADGSLSVGFVPRVQNPEVNGIEIIAHGVSREEAEEMAEELKSAGEEVEQVLEDVSLKEVELPEGSWGGMLPVAMTYLLQQQGAEVGFCELVAGSGWAFSFSYDYDNWHVAALSLDQFDWLPRQLGYEVRSVSFADSGAAWEMIMQRIGAGEPVASTIGDGGLIKGYRVRDGRAQFLFEGEPVAGWMDLTAHPMDRCAVLGRTGAPRPEREIVQQAVVRAARIASPRVEDGVPRGMAALEAYLADVEDPAKDFEGISEWFCWATFERLAARKCCADWLRSAADVLGGQTAEALRTAADHYERAFDAYHEYDRLVHENEDTGMSLQERLRTPERIAVLSETLRAGIEAERAGVVELSRAAELLQAAEAARERAVLEGVPAYRFTDPMFEALRVVMSHRGEDYSAAYVQGISGMAFRLAGPCPCAPTSSAPMEVPELAALFGYEAEGLYLGDEREDVDARLPEAVARVKDEVRAGRAAIVWNAFTTAEWDVACGYDDAQGLFYGRGSYGDMRGEQYASAPQERMGDCLSICPAFGIVVLGDKTGALDGRAAELAALKEAVRHGREPGDRLPHQTNSPRYHTGPDPYEWWIANPPSGWDYCLDVTRSRRRAGVEFMREIAPRYPNAREAMLQAAEHFRSEADALDAVTGLWQGEEAAPQMQRERTSKLLGRARSEYEAAIGRIEAALEALGEQQAELL